MGHLLYKALVLIPLLGVDFSSSFFLTMFIFLSMGSKNGPPTKKVNNLQAQNSPSLVSRKVK